MKFKKFAVVASLGLPLFASASAAKVLLPSVAAPDLSYKDIQGTVHSVASAKGKVLVLNYWLPKCPPCVRELPALNKLVDSFAADKVIFLAPAFDTRENVEGFLKAHPMKYKPAFSANDNAMQLYPDGNIVFPLHVVIGHDGTIVYRRTGEVNEKALTQAIKRAVKQAAAN
jgi:peroxiredoxin